MTIRLIVVALAILALAACGSTEDEGETAVTPAVVEPAPPVEAAPTTILKPSATPVPATPVLATPTPAAAAAGGVAVDAAVAARTLVQLVDPLDEPEFYCVDVPGFGSSLRLEAALMAHTCKPGADDEIFAVNQPGPGNLVMPAYDLCMEASGTESPAELVLQECSDSAMQQFVLDDEGALALAGTGLCVAVAPGVGEPTGGPSHVRRDLVLVDCGDAEPALRQWAFPGPSPE